MEVQSTRTNVKVQHDNDVAHLTCSLAGNLIWRDPGLINSSTTSAEAVRVGTLAENTWSSCDQSGLNWGKAHSSRRISTLKASSSLAWIFAWWQQRALSKRRGG